MYLYCCFLSASHILAMSKQQLRGWKQSQIDTSAIPSVQDAKIDDEVKYD